MYIIRRNVLGKRVVIWVVQKFNRGGGPGPPADPLVTPLTWGRLACAVGRATCEVRLRLVVGVGVGVRILRGGRLCAITGSSSLTLLVTFLLLD